MTKEKKECLSEKDSPVQATQTERNTVSAAELAVYEMRHKECTEKLLEDVKELFGYGGLSMLMNLLHDLCGYISEDLSKYEDMQGEGEINLKYASNTVYQASVVMWKLSEIYEGHKGIEHFKNLINKKG